MAGLNTVHERKDQVMNELRIDSSIHDTMEMAFKMELDTKLKPSSITIDMVIKKLNVAVIYSIKQ